MSAVLEALRAIGPKSELIRVRGAEFSVAYCIFGGIDRFSAKEVRESVAEGELVIDGDRVRINPAILREESSKRRSEAAYKAQETYRNEPLSPSARRLLSSLAFDGGRATVGMFDRQAAGELSRKGYASRCQIKLALGVNLWGYFDGLEISGRGIVEVQGRVA